MSGASYETLEGHNIEIGCNGDSLTVNGVKMVLKKDIVTTNGVIHLIDEVLMPDSGSNRLINHFISLDLIVNHRFQMLYKICHVAICQFTPMFKGLLN